jgi:anti-anti-sigma regulatory factor
MESTFRVIARSTDSSDYITMLGNIDASAEQQLQSIPDMLDTQIAYFDFGKAGRINSMGIALLLRCFKKIRDEKKAEIFLRELNTTNTMLFKMTGVFLLASHETSASK